MNKKSHLKKHIFEAFLTIKTLTAFVVSKNKNSKMRFFSKKTYFLVFQRRSLVWFYIFKKT